MLFLDRWDTKRSQKKGFNVYSEQIVLRCPKPKKKKKNRTNPNSVSDLDEHPCVLDSD